MVLCSSLVLVSTLDGQLSALDTKENGKLLWSLPAFHGPLLSSSLSSIQVLYEERGFLIIFFIIHRLNGTYTLSIEHIFDVGVCRLR